MAVTGEDAVNAINGTFGSHRGARAAHARGTVCRGLFTPTADAAKLTSAAHMQGPVEVTVRFSNASGDPGIADRDPDARGMAVKFGLRGGETTDIVAVTLPCFFVSRPEDFIELNVALKRKREDRPLSKLVSLLRLAPFYVRHKEARPGIRSILRFKPVPSYANCRFNALHAFKWVDGGGRERYVRYSWRPEAGEQTLSGSDAKKRSRDYLQQDLYDRLGRVPVRPIRFTLELQIASEEDLRCGRICNPTSIWPGERQDKKPITPAGGGDKCARFVDAGMLEVTGLAEGSANSDEPLIFDPTKLTGGIEAPVLENGTEPRRDEILHLRPEAYDVSFERRTSDGEGGRK
jgi:catalase